MVWLTWQLLSLGSNKKKKLQPHIGMAGVVIVDIAYMGIIVIEVIVTCLVSELVSYYFLK